MSFSFCPTVHHVELSTETPFGHRQLYGKREALVTEPARAAIMAGHRIRLSAVAMLRGSPSREEGLDSDLQIRRSLDFGDTNSNRLLTPWHALQTTPSVRKICNTSSDA